MREWTEQEEQEMIERAKAGDPEANYELSLWALRRGEEEPEESRWNRLAAKCLVKAAEAGYAPAQERMESLLKQDGAKPARKKTADRPRKGEPPAPVKLSEARKNTARQSTARRPAAPEEPEDDFVPWEDGEDDEDRPSPRRSGGSGIGAFFSRWSEAQWRTMEIICVGICAILLAAILILVFTGRKSGSAPTGSAMPPANEAQTVEATPTPEPVQYPDDATRAEIMAADLQVYPMEENYETVPTTGTVSVNSISLRLRMGPNTSYDVVDEMTNGTVVDVFARKDGFALVRYDGDEGAVYGWCSTDYLVLSAGSAG